MTSSIPPSKKHLRTLLLWDSSLGLLASSAVAAIDRTINTPAASPAEKHRMHAGDRDFSVSAGLDRPFCTSISEC
ncbi:hypothetical protein [Tychonema sp. LEGE 07203]|uniref:hypothetical protein n=1 Tax=Tychonema sp. LEGE 07203 TaxID=1828671 RepID=UPI00187FA49E|nr:hypothetical protein [Tychonema sp. LEGE 07203]MBE9094217.1 hypothetical protein [Tychonema sp. LEGE 07203]